jgi:FkbM family methyltransferase
VIGRRLRAAIAALRGDLPRLLAARAAGLNTTAAAAGGHTTAVQPPEFDIARAEWTSGARPEGVQEAVIAGLRFTVPPDSGPSRSLSDRVLRGRLPFEDIAAIRRLVRNRAPGGVMVDVGANIGTTSIPRIALGDFDRAYVVEPDRTNYACLVANIADNHLDGRIVAGRLAIADTSGAARLRISPRIGGHQLIRPGHALAEPQDDVRCATLDGWLDERGVELGAVTFVKVDTQGWDVRVLHGAPRLLAGRRSVWQVEVSPSHMKAAGSTIEDLAALVVRHFTHAACLGDAGPETPASSIAGLLARALDGRRFANLVFYNRST